MYENKVTLAWSWVIYYDRVTLDLIRIASCLCYSNFIFIAPYLISACLKTIKKLCRNGEIKERCAWHVAFLTRNINWMSLKVSTQF